MTRGKATPVPAPWRRCAVGILGDDRGIAAVEFALILPIMLLLMFGMSAVVETVLTVHKIERAANSVANVVASKVTGGATSGQGGLTDLDVSEAFKAAEFLLSPLPAADLHMDIYEIQLAYTGKTGSGATANANYNYQAKVVWKASQNGLNQLQCGVPLTAGSDGPNTLPGEYLRTVGGTSEAAWQGQKDRYIIVTHVRYDYTSSFGSGPFLTRPRSWQFFRAGHSQNRSVAIPEHIQNKTSGAATTCPSMINP
ncbi:hypothetical protein [Methylocystis echinoides]|uniref:TadE family protein n=1 Tax=Methylocystis echinoides TaxID=29468 RepID=A0A9W6GV97_9HYPH|nr:hypothetical protein [Methylocystis echinoides]GLI93748.1 hypothetical protein LMG27198_27400 [Methylocystis echinoides]